MTTPQTTFEQFAKEILVCGVEFDRGGVNRADRGLKKGKKSKNRPFSGTKSASRPMDMCASSS
jgi:hypothetical protein